MSIPQNIKNILKETIFVFKNQKNLKKELSDKKLTNYLNNKNYSQNLKQKQNLINERENPKDNNLAIENT